MTSSWAERSCSWPSRALSLPTCHHKHLPGYVEKAQEISDKGVDAIAVTSVNDVWVLDAWAKSTGAEGIEFLADGNGEFAKRSASRPTAPRPASAPGRGATPWCRTTACAGAQRRGNPGRRRFRAPRTSCAAFEGIGVGDRRDPQLAGRAARAADGGIAPPFLNGCMAATASASTRLFIGLSAWLLDPVPRHPRRAAASSRARQLDVLHGLVVGGLPASALPVRQPGRDPLHDVLRVGEEVDRAGR